MVANTSVRERLIRTFRRYITQSESNRPSKRRRSRSACE